MRAQSLIINYTLKCTKKSIADRDFFCQNAKTVISYRIFVNFNNLSLEFKSKKRGILFKMLKDIKIFKNAVQTEQKIV